jgi:hypothetical protein
VVGFVPSTVDQQRILPRQVGVCGLVESLASVAEGVEVQRSASALRFLPRRLGFDGRCGL